MTPTVDVDPLETREWLDSLHAVLQHEGEARVSYLLDQLTDEAHRAGLSTSATLTTPYVNTIFPERAERPKWDRDIEHRIRSIIRWNAVANGSKTCKSSASSSRSTANCPTTSTT